VWQPGTYITFLLAIAEAVMKRGCTISLFALDYSLTPEAGFPTQVGQVAAMYKYLVEEMGVDYRKVAIMGDSAGGHLALSFLAHLHSPTPLLSPNPSAGLPKPEAGAFLISPCVTFDTSCSTYKTNDGIDMLSKSAVTRFGRFYFMASEHASTDSAKPYHEFLHNAGSRDWVQTLPKKVFVSAGANEAYVEDIQRAVEAMRESGTSVQFSLGKDKAHDWQFTDCLKAEATYLQTALEEAPSVQLDGVEELAEALAGVL
jgi:acetyl esterase/lipase